MKSLLLINKWQKMRTNGKAATSPRDFKPKINVHGGACCMASPMFTHGLHSRMSVAEEWHAEWCWYQDIQQSLCGNAAFHVTVKRKKQQQQQYKFAPFRIDIHLFRCENTFLISSFFFSFLFLFSPCYGSKFEFLTFFLNIFLFIGEIWNEIYFCAYKFWSMKKKYMELGMHKAFLVLALI